MKTPSPFANGILITLIALGLLFGLLQGCKQDTRTGEAAVVALTAKPPTELLDISLSEPARKSLDAFSQMDLDGFTDEFADDIRYSWSSGDSLKGKQAVKDYYAGRFKLIESISFTDHIFLPIQINQSPTRDVSTGRWLLQWVFAHIQYKNGKRVDLWIHNVNHYNEAGKIDFLGQYMDRYPIMEATRDMMKK